MGRAFERKLMTIDEFIKIYRLPAMRTLSEVNGLRYYIRVPANPDIAEGPPMVVVEDIQRNGTRLFAMIEYRKCQEGTN